MDTNSSSLLLMSLAKFYKKRNTMSQIVGIINAKSKISLRLIDWFVTNYSKKQSTVITFENGSNVNIYISYRSQLKAYSKHKFDPFRRRGRISFYYEKDAFIETTIGQLNFFRWILENNIMQFVDEHFDDIEQDMLLSHKENHDKKLVENEPAVTVGQTDVLKAPKVKKKRSELSKSFVKTLNRCDGSYVVRFD